MLSILIPTIRTRNIDPLLESLKGAISTAHEVIWEEDVERIGAPKMVKKLFDKSQGDWVCFLGDDTLPDAQCLDNALAYAKANDLFLVGLNDQHSKKATHWIASREFLNSLENAEPFYTGYYHNFCDDELRHRAQMLGKYEWCAEAKLQHNHPAFGTGIMDEDYHRVFEGGRWEHDKALFIQRCGKISVVMIVKNEEAMLETCLRSVQGADEIIVVDTGSIDNTIAIAIHNLVKVHNFEWCDDFAAARNFALSKATGDWVLSIDADEVLEEGGIEELKELLATEKNAIGITMSSVNDQYNVPRLFKRIPSTKWVGKIHEVINDRDMLNTDTIIEYGTSPAHDLDPKRNIRIMEKVAEEDPNNSRNLFYLGREYGYYGEWEKAIDTLNKYFPIATWLPERADAYFIQAVCYTNLPDWEKARQCCLQAMNINSNFKAPILLMAHLSWEHNAVQWNKLAETATNEKTLFARFNHLTI